MQHTAFLTSSLIGVIGESYTLLKSNGFVDKLRSCWKAASKILIVSSSPDEYSYNDDFRKILRQALRSCGFSFTSLETCDNRNPNITDRLNEMDVIVLTGGHVPTQNAFMHSIHLKERLESFKGIVIGWSAGSMNCADVVYASPELDGEAIDPEYKRYIPGLAITEINIFPHFQSLRDEKLDGLRIVEDITFGDSFKHEVIAINDGSWILVDENGTETLFGEGYLIKDGKMEQICKNGESFVLSKK